MDIRSKARLATVKTDSVFYILQEKYTLSCVDLNELFYFFFSSFEIVFTFAS